MGGFFGVASQTDCVADLFYGTDYHCHLGTMRGGMAITSQGSFVRFIHDITNAQFRSKFEDDLTRMHGNLGIGVISDYEDQPLIIGSHLGTYALVTVGRINNIDELAAEAFRGRTTHFSEMGGAGINPTELVATLINREDSFAEGIRRAQEVIDGSCSLLLLTEDAIYAARDRLGRTPIAIGWKSTGYAVTLETCAFPNLDYEVDRYLGPGETVRITAERRRNRESARRRHANLLVPLGLLRLSRFVLRRHQLRGRAQPCGAALARDDDHEIDIVASVPDSGTGHAIGYANGSGIPYGRPFVKYTPDVAAEFHAPRPASPRPRCTYETHSHSRTDPRQAGAVLRRFDRSRHAVARHDLAAVRLRRS